MNIYFSLLLVLILITIYIWPDYTGQILLSGAIAALAFDNLYHDNKSSVNGGINKYYGDITHHDHVGKYYGGINKYNTDTYKYNDGVDKDNDGVDKDNDGVDKYYGGVDKYNDSVDKYYGGVDKYYGGVDKYYGGVDKYYGTINDYHGGAFIPPKQIIQQIKLATRAFFSILRGSSLTTISASLETLGSGLPLDTLSDIAGVCLEAFITITTIGSKIASMGASFSQSKIKELLKLSDFSNGPTGIYQQVKPQFEQFKQDPNSNDLLNELCNAYSEILMEAGNFLAQLISAFIPNDFGTAQLAIRLGVTGVISVTQLAANLVTRNPFEIITAIYKLVTNTHLPLEVNILIRDFLQNKEKRKQYLKNLFMFIRTLIQERIDFTYWQRFKYSFANQAIFFGLYGLASLTLFLPGWIFLFGITQFTVLNAHIITTLLNLGIGNKQFIYLLDTYILPDEQIEKMSNAIEYIVTQAFIGALVISECKNLTTTPPDQINATEVAPDKVVSAINQAPQEYHKAALKKHNTSK